MGKIRQLLAGTRDLQPRNITSNQIWADLCEDIHLHYRNLRLDFSMIEWAMFRAAVNHLGKAVEYSIDKYDYVEGDPNFLVGIYFNELISSNTEYYPNRCTIEFQKDNTVHFHYRDVRLHWTLEEFKEIGDLFIHARERIKVAERTESPFKDIKTATHVTARVDMIQPYDAGHLPFAEDKEHRDGIEYVKTLITTGAKIRPILVATDGQRLDGFKRYMAFKELGYDTIKCIIDPWGKMGGQHNQSFTLSPEENKA